jgi:hypothetical protein
MEQREPEQRGGGARGPRRWCGQHHAAYLLHYKGRVAELLPPLFRLETSLQPTQLLPLAHLQELIKNKK